MSSDTIFKKASVAGSEIDVFPLETISLASLEANDVEERERVVRAAEDPGFFYLSLENTELQSIFDDEESLYKLAEAYFDQPHDAKLRDHRVDLDRGYQFCASDETFEIARDELTPGGDALALPPLLQGERPLLERFSSLCDAITQGLLGHLAQQLAVADRAWQHHRRGAPSATGLKLVHEPTRAAVADVAENKHTDGGTLTLLFGRAWGMHLRSGDEGGGWAFVEPRPRRVLVNVADALQRLSGGRLRSGLHRVTQPVDGAGKRYYITYFLRPSTAVE